MRKRDHERILRSYQDEIDKLRREVRLLRALLDEQKPKAAPEIMVSGAAALPPGAPVIARR